MTLVSWKLIENIANRIFSLLPFLPVCDKVQSPHFTTHLISGDFINVSFPGRACSFTGSCLSQQLRTFCFTGLIFLLCFPIHPSFFILWPIFTLALFSKRRGREWCASLGRKKGRKWQAGRVRNSLNELGEFQWIYKSDSATCTYTIPCHSRSIWDFLELRECYNQTQHTQNETVTKYTSRLFKPSETPVCFPRMLCSAVLSILPVARHVLGCPLFILCYVEGLPTPLKSDRVELVLAQGTPWLHFPEVKKPQHIC